jgi:hypothetical protein
MEIELAVDPPRPKPSTRLLKRFIVPSDTHPFVGRVYSLSIVAYHFDSYDDLARHADCKYAFDVNMELSTLTRRVESLNLAGSMLWPDPVPSNFKEFPVSRYEWLTVAADVFLLRYISVVDCALLITNEVFEVSLERRKCSIGNLKKRGVPQRVTSLLEELQADQGALRDERNARFHHGAERGITGDDMTFQIAALFEHRGSGVRGRDQDGRRINVERSFREGLLERQREFNQASQKLVRQLDRLYDELGMEFESRFVPRFRAGPFRRGIRSHGGG